ncbi:hypothetical protein [Solibacillus sp. FSL H8-0538]|uniref:hypothetical protein n=1 Tax=Solibacillus sp. FSL H8-0538 TaxID=2921400 RepID=UPI0030F58748
MRNAVAIDEMIVTIDNAGCIGEKEADLVQVPNEVNAYFTARVAVLEQWCAGAKPAQLLLANFSGNDAWDGYLRGFQQVFDEISEPLPPVTGSSESNFESLQSGLSLTIIGRPTFHVTKIDCQFFLVGMPLVGDAVIANAQKVAKLGEIHTALQANIVTAVWPTGSKGIGAEIERFIGAGYTCDIDLQCSAGPSTAVLVAVREEFVEKFNKLITAPVKKIYRA